MAGDSFAAFLCNDDNYEEYNSIRKSIPCQVHTQLIII
jgi:hypothetical protein